MSQADFPNATPRPWYFDGWDIFTSGSAAGPRGDGHRLVVPLSHLNETFHSSQKVSEDDARLIVAAVNERDALVAEIQQLRDVLSRCANYIESDIEGMDDWIPSELQDARTALGRTEDGPPRAENREAVQPSEDA